MSLKIRDVLPLFTFALAACSVDRTITHGADGEPEWDRRLAEAIAVGIPADSARSVMIRNGFRCELRADSVRYLGCEKMRSRRFTSVSRHWLAVLSINDQGRIAHVRAKTRLIRQ